MPISADTPERRSNCKDVMHGEISKHKVIQMHSVDSDYLSGFTPEMFLLQLSTLHFIREDDGLVRRALLLQYVASNILNKYNTFLTY